MNTTNEELIIKWYAHKVQDIALAQLKAGRVFDDPVDQLSEALSVLCFEIDRNSKLRDEFNAIFHVNIKK